MLVDLKNCVLEGKSYWERFQRDLNVGCEYLQCFNEIFVGANLKYKKRDYTFW